VEAREEYDIVNVNDKHNYELEKVREEKHSIIKFLMEYNKFLIKGKTTNKIAVVQMMKKGLKL
jgi:hypothetical protein